MDSSIKSIDFSFWRGIKLTDFTIQNPPGFKQKELLKVKQAFLKPALFPLLKKRLVISTIVFQEPEISLERNQEGKWNIAHFLSIWQKAPLKKKNPRGKAFSFRIYKVIIRQADINFSDLKIESSFSRRFKDFNLKVIPIGRFLALGYQLSFFIQEDETKVDAQGKFFPLVKRGKVDLKIQHLCLSALTPYFNKFTPFSFDNGHLDLNAEFSVNKDKLDSQCRLDLSQVVFFLNDVYEHPLVFSKGKITSRLSLNKALEEITFQDSSISIAEINLNGKGKIKSFGSNPQLTFNFSSPVLDLKNLTFVLPAGAKDFYKSLNPEGPFKISNGEIFIPFKRMPKTKYKFTAEIEKTGFSLPLLNSKIENAAGSLNFDEEKIQTENFQAQIEKLPFAVSGNWGLKPQSKVKLEIPFSKFSLENLQNALNENFKYFALPFNFQGKGKGKLKLSGTSKKLNWKGHLDFINANLFEADGTNRIKKINGQLEFNRNSLSAKSLKGEWQNTPLTLSGKLKNFNQTELELNLNGEKINLKGKAKFYKNSGELLDLHGDYGGIPIKAHGKFKKLTPLTVECTLKSSPLNLEKLIEILPAGFKPVYKKLGLAGQADFKTNFSGEFSDWKTWQVNGNLSFPESKIIQLKLKEFSCPFNLDKQKLSLPDLKAVFYGGSVHGDFQINLSELCPSHQGNLLFSNVNLAELTKDTDWNNRDIQGLAGTEISFNGFGADWNRLKGRGWLHLSGSRLWKIPLLGELSNILLIPGLDKTIIQEGHCNFNINQGRIYTKDLELLSDNLSLKAEGSAGFDTTLDFDILMQFSGALRKKTADLTKLADLILKTVEQLLVQAELKGTITEPQYILRPFPVEKILERKLKNKIGNFLEDLLKEKK